MGPDTERILTDLTDRQDNNIGERKITGPTAKLCVASVSDSEELRRIELSGINH